MMIDSEKILSVTEVNQNFSKAAKMADQYGNVVIFKNNKPKYVLYDIDSCPQVTLSENELIEAVGRRILKEHKAAFEELAK